MLAPLCKRVRAGNGDAQTGKAGLPAEVAHERDEGLDLLLGGRRRKHDRGLTQIGKARERESGVREDSRLGSGAQCG